MNPQPELQSDALRSQIDSTRERMDETIDALGNRLEGRHLLDELIGFFRGRSSHSSGDGTGIGERLSHSAESAMHSVVDTVKAHPIPTLMIGAGIGMLVYESRSRRHRAETDDSSFASATETYSEFGAEPYASTSYGSTGETAGETGEEAPAPGAAAGAKAKLAHLGDKAREQMSGVRALGREKLDTARERLSHLSGDVRARGRELYGATRERVVTTADRHPLELALGCLAAGFVVGLALPTPNVVNRRLGPKVDQLRDRTRAAGADLIEKGKRVVQAAASAAKVEAKTQGLSVANLRGEESQASSEPPAGSAAVGGTTAAPGTASRPAAGTPPM